MVLNKISDLKLLSPEERNLILKELKNIKGVSIRKLSRLTGLSRTLITKTLITKT